MGDANGATIGIYGSSYLDPYYRKLLIESLSEVSYRHPNYLRIDI